MIKMKFEEDEVICPICGNKCIAFHNYSYYDCYTVRCGNCKKEYDYALKQHFLDNPKNTYPVPLQE